MRRIFLPVLGLAFLLAATESATADIFFESTRGKGGHFVADDNGKRVRPFHPPKGVPADELPTLSADSKAGVFYGPGRTVTLARTPSGKILKRAKVSGCVVAGLADDLKHVFCSKSGTVSLNARVSVFSTSTLRGPLLSEHSAGAAFNPGGRSVAWNEGFQVFVAAADGSGKRLLADLSQLGDDAPVAQVQLAEWGPGQIALIGQSSSASRDIWLVDDASGTMRRLTHFPPKDENCSGYAMNPVRFSRDGSRLLAAGGIGEPIYRDVPSTDEEGNPTTVREFVDCKETRGAYAVDLANGSVRHLHDEDNSLDDPRLSRDGRSVLVTSRNSIYRVDFATGSAKRVLRNAAQFGSTG
jgi:hypothetical protein